MQKVLAGAVAAFLFGCASPSATKPSPAPVQQPMPDGRELSEHPLDVLNLPQP